MRKLTLLTLAAASLFLVSCTKDSKDNPDNPTTQELPKSYNFENVNHSGQDQRLAMLSEIADYMKVVNSGGTVSAAQLTAMFNNSGYTWTNTDLNSSTKQLTDKIADGEGPQFGEWFNTLETSSQSTTPGSNGTAGLVSSNSGTRTYLFDAKGFEQRELIEKGAMGAIFYYQATSVYMSGTKMNVDNETVTPGKGTEMQHHWDEAFGYWGAPVDIATDGFTYDSGAEYHRFWTKYINSLDPVLNCNEKLMNAFIKGRDAINRKDYTTRDIAIKEARAFWEEVCAGMAIHYLNGAKADFADDAMRNHQLSEALGFIYSLKFNAGQTATDQEIDNLIESFQNLYEITVLDITTSRDWIADKFNLTDHKEVL